MRVDVHGHRYAGMAGAGLSDLQVNLELEQLRKMAVSTGMRRDADQASPLIQAAELLGEVPRSYKKAWSEGNLAANLVDEMRWVSASEATLRDMRAKDEELHAEAARLENAIVAAEPTTLEDVGCAVPVALRHPRRGYPTDDRDVVLIQTITRRLERLAGIPPDTSDHRVDPRSLPTALS